MEKHNFEEGKNILKNCGKESFTIFFLLKVLWWILKETQAVKGKLLNKTGIKVFLFNVCIWNKGWQKLEGGLFESFLIFSRV